MNAPKKKGKADIEAGVRKGNPTLVARGAIYGDYRDGVTIRHELMSTLKEGYRVQNGAPMPPLYQEYLWDICNKLSRLAKCPQHIDSWHDVAGYAQLIENAIKESKEGI